MKLTVKDRLNFAALYPEKGNILQQILVKGIVEKVSVTPKEAEEIELKVNGNQVMWNLEKAKTHDKKVEFSEAELNLLKEQVKLLDTRGEINQNILGLCLAIQGK
jgi:hypothetical protein